MRSPIKKVYHCPWCKEGSGLILPEDLSKAIRMPDGSLKYYTCQTEELRSRIIRVTPNAYLDLYLICLGDYLCNIIK